MRVWTLWCVLVIALFPSLAFAWDGEEDLKGDESLHVIVGPGARQLDPLAIPETRCVRAPARACSTVVQVLRRDMTLSFLFKVLPERSYLVDPQTEPFETPSYEDWANIGARYVVASQVTGPEPYKAQFRLFSVAEQRALEAVEAQGCALQSLCELRHDLAAATPSSSSSGPCNPSAAPSSSSRTGQNPSTARAEDSATAEQVITQAVNEGHGEEYIAMLCQDALDRGVMSRAALDALLDLLHLQFADAHPEEEVAIPGILGEAPVTPEDEEEEPFEDHGTADMEVAQMIAMAELQLMQESERGEWGSSCCM